MRLLLDTNIFLEVILGQDAADQARAVLAGGAGHDLFVTDYTTHSIGLLLFRQGRRELLEAVVEDMVAGGFRPVGVPLESLGSVANAAEKFRLDFDDAYQYTAAELNELRLVSFDADFDRTERGRMSPIEL